MPTTSTTVGRLQVDHPDLGHDAGAGLHTKIRTIYTKLADNIGARYFEVDALANSASIDFDHNFKDAFSNLRVHLFERNTGDGELTRLVSGGSPDLDDFTIVATPGNLTTQLRITNNTGSVQDLSVIIFQGAFAEKLADLSDIASLKASLGNVAVSGDVTLTDKRVHLVDTTADRLLTLPAANANLYLTVKDISGQAQTNAITLTTPGAELIDGAATYVIDANYNSVSVVSDGTDYFIL
jgi:hypothetical protein